MRILGIDPGSRVTGFGVLDFVGVNATYVASGVDHFFHGKLNLLRDVVIEKLEKMGVVQCG